MVWRWIARRWRRWAAGGAVAMACVATACAAGLDRQCRIGADCLSGACDAEGRCVDVDDANGNDDDGAAGAAATGGGAGVGTGGSGGTTSNGGAGTGASCLPNQDGAIVQAEVPLQAGLMASYRAAQDVTFNSTGTDQGGGLWHWDLSAAFTGDHATVIETQTVAGSWYADGFAAASYATRLSDEEDLLGVFQITTDALLLLGVVSPQDGVTRTELTYDPPVTMLDFPLSVGKTWSAATTVSGVAQGVAAFYTEDYSFAVDKAGTADTPFASFEVQRVHAELVRTVGLLTTTSQTHVFVAECFGPVAHVASQDHELSTEFTDVRELRRLAP